MPESDQLTLVLAVLTPILGVSTLYLGIKHYRESSRKKRYMGEALLSIQSIMKKLQWIDETIRDLSTVNDESDANNDITVIEEDILRAHFDVKANNFTLHFQVSEIKVEKGEDQRYESNADADHHVIEMLDRREIRRFGTHTDIEGVERRVVNSPDLGELVVIHHYLLDIMDEIDRFKETYEALGPNLIELVRGTADSVRDIIVDSMHDREIQVDLVTLSNYETLHAYMFDELLNIKRLKGEASQVQEIMTAIQDLRKEIFRISYLQP